MSVLDLRPVPCDYCGAIDAKTRFVGRDRLLCIPGEFPVVRCTGCGLDRTNPQPTPETLGAAYPEGYEIHDVGVELPESPSGALRHALVNLRGYPLGEPAGGLSRLLQAIPDRRRLAHRRMVGYVPWRGEGRLLDFGCGSGRYVARMAAAGWRAEGIDAVERAVAEGRERGLALSVGTLPGTVLEPESFDVVTMWHVLEHVPSPLSTLRAVRELLKPGGALHLVCPLSDSLTARWTGPAWYGLDVPRHLTHFTRGTLRRHLVKAGFDLETVRSFRRPAFLSRSFRALAEDTRRPLHRWLGRSHALSRGLSHLAGLLRRTDEALFTAVAAPRGG
jgi:SAM-dependent methyltransferase